MKLVDLDPRWLRAADSPTDAKQGISFLCPHCQKCRLGVFFTPTICGNPPAVPDPLLHDHLQDTHLGKVLWERTGETFETMSLKPSIDASRWGCWHGWVTNGECV